MNLRECQLKVSMSIQQCYEQFFKEKIFDQDTRNDRSDFNIDLNCFKIYSNLVKNGFIVRRTKHASNQEAAAKREKKKPDPAKESNDGKSPELKPIVKWSEHERLTQFEIYKRLSKVVSNVSIDELRERLLGAETASEPATNCHKSLFEVNQPDKRFQKSKSPQADFNVFAPRHNPSGRLTVPGLDDFISNSSTDKLQIYAFTDDANQPIYYSFDFNFSIPSIVKQ